MKRWGIGVAVGLAALGGWWAWDGQRDVQRFEGGPDMRSLKSVRAFVAHLKDEARRKGLSEVGDGEGDALAFGVRHHDDELAGLSGAGHQGMMDLQHVSDVGVILARHDLESGPYGFIHGVSPFRALAPVERGAEWALVKA